MPVSESMLHPYIKGLVEEHGKLTVTELNTLLREVLTLDETDLEILTNRSDDKFSQIVRNVVSHAGEDVVSKYGYILDKTTKPVTFYASHKSSVIASEEIERRKIKSKSFHARKVDYKTLNIERSELGLAGEIFALQFERQRLYDEDISFDTLNEVIHTSQVFGDGAGYDILSRNNAKDLDLLYIEVKTTKGDLKSPFYMSKNEKEFIEVYKENCFIYRVYNFNSLINLGEIEIISYEKLMSEYIFNPVTFVVTKK